MLVRLEPATPQSRVKHSTTEPQTLSGEQNAIQAHAGVYIYWVDSHSSCRTSAVLKYFCPLPKHRLNVHGYLKDLYL